MTSTSPELILPSARGGRRPASPLLVEIERELTLEDLQEHLAGSAPAVPQTASLSSIRHSHHRIAQLIAEGRDGAEVSLITGYSPSYISVLRSDPAFAELLAYYTSQREAIFIDTVERMKVLGLSTLDELASRLEADPTKFSHRELMELAELTLSPTIAPKAGAAGPGGAGGGPAVALSISFVAPAQAAGESSAKSTPIIEGTLND